MFRKKIVYAILMVLLFVCSQVFAQTAEVTLSGSTWTTRVGTTVVYTGSDMAAAVNAAANGMTGGTINIRNTGTLTARITPRANQTLDFHGNTIVSADNNIPIYADRRNGITIRNVHMTGSPRYGMWFRGSSNLHLHNIVMELSHAPAVGIGIRVDNNRDVRVTTTGLRMTGYIRIEGTLYHAFETYGISGVEIERIITRNTGGCGVLLNETRDVHIRYINAYRANYGGGMAGFRTANNCGPNVVLDTLIATNCGRGFFSLTGSHGVTINYVEITGSTGLGIWIENVPNNRVLSGYVWNNRNNVSISGTNVQGSSVNVQNSPPPASPPPPPPAAATITRTPTSLSFGTVVVGQTATLSYTLSAANLTPASGNITVTAPAGFAVSLTETGTYTTSVTVAYTAGALASRTIWVRFSPTAAQAFSGNITNTGGGAPAVTVAVTGTGQAAPPPPPPAVTRIFRGNGNLFDSLFVYETANAQSWSVMTNLATGQIVYGDRTFTIETIPQGLAGGEWIQTAMNSRTNSTLSQYATLIARESGVLYIAHSDRVTTKPQWLSTFTQTNMVITIRESATVTRTLTVFSRPFAQGERIALGINSNDGTTTSNMYIPILMGEPVTDIAETVSEVTELAIAVSPNPFNPVATISYSLPSASFVELRVFNINGALVEELVKDSKNAGVHTVSFDGSRLPSGVYFARMSANGRVLQKKMILLK